MSAMRRDDVAAHAPLVEVMPMRRRHLRGVMGIEAQQVHRPWSATLFSSELGHGTRRTYLVAKVGGAVAGYGGLLHTGFESHVTTLMVDPDRRGSRVGTRLLLALVDAARQVGSEGLTLEVRAGNEPALALYRRFGFVPAGVRKNYYDDLGEDALILWVYDLDDDAYLERLAEIRAALPGPTILRGMP